MKSTIKYIFQLLLFFVFLRSLNAWFTWELNNIVLVFYVLIGLLFIVTHEKELSFKRNFATIFLFGAAMISLEYGFNGAKLVGTFPIVIFLATSRKFKVQTLDLITRYWLYILIPSLIFFLGSFFISFPNLGQIEHPNWDAYVYTNYVIFIKGQFYDIRFNSIFLEPGHLGMILSFFLFAYKFDLSKWEVWAMLIIQIFTLSLAGYILVAIGYTLTLIAQNRSFIKFILSIFLILGATYSTAKFYNNGNNLLNALIVSRLEYDQEKGIAGNNRATTDADDYVDRMLSNGQILWGLPESSIKDENLGAGWKIFLIRYGAISMAFFFLFYFISTRANIGNGKYNMLFLALLIAAFIQRSYPWWESWIIPYFCGMSYHFLHNDVIKKDKPSVVYPRLIPETKDL